FTFWVRQDYLFLIEYSRLFALAAARSPDLSAMTAFAELLRATLTEEMALHRSYAAESGISAADLEREPMAPVTQGYTDFLLRTAALGSYGELLAALLPCMWGFSEVGRRLARRGRPKEDRYARWIDLYASPEFAKLARWCRDLLDEEAKGLPQGERRRLERAFLTSSRYEYLFWEMAWRQERWPV
ncbi:MAG: thiaminase II, partial [Chloroflexi bacterium]|nr:thiaminase II [Chloroflexota bacterium]